MMSFIVIGTDTEIGKTITCAILLARYAATIPFAYWKPIATGSIEDRDTLTVKSLCGNKVEVLPESYLFEPPVSPHLAARQAGRVIDPQKILQALNNYQEAEPNRPLLIEGVGGLLVPLNEKGYLLADLIQEMNLPCLLVSSSRLGTINHTLLTLEALRTRQISLLGVILNGPHNKENRSAIEKFGKAKILGEVEPLDPLTPENITSASLLLDPQGYLGSRLKKPENTYKNVQSSD